MPDTLYADVSEWQVGVDDSYPYRVLCIRSNDGTYQDRHWRHNYYWCRRNADSGRLTFFISYFVFRPNWQQTIDTLRKQVGTPHPKMAVMIDVESWGGQIVGDQSAELNAAVRAAGEIVGSTDRVLGYGNLADLDSLWPHRPADLRLVVAAYGHNPRCFGKVSHQYTDGSGHGGGLPEGAAPFGNCDMNSADGLTHVEFARACGIAATDEP